MNGSIIVDIVKFLKNYEKANKLPALSPRARQLMDGRVGFSEWYPLAVFHELLRVIDTLVLRGDEQRALEMGAAGGNALRGLQKAYGVDGEARVSILAMRHAWRAHYNFGGLTLDVPDDGPVVLRIEGYPDIPMVHALFTTGWGVATARHAGAAHVRHEIVNRPWTSAGDFVCRLHL